MKGDVTKERGPWGSRKRPEPRGKTKCTLKLPSLCQSKRYMLSAPWGKTAQSCPTLCNPFDCSLLGSSVHGIFQARILEWVAISFQVYKTVSCPMSILRASSGPLCITDAKKFYWLLFYDIQEFTIIMPICSAQSESSFMDSPPPPTDALEAQVTWESPTECTGVLVWWCDSSRKGYLPPASVHGLYGVLLSPNALSSLHAKTPSLSLLLLR